MKRARFLTILLAMVAFASRPASAAPGTTLGVFAAASLAGAFGDIARAFERAHAGVRVQLNLAGTQMLVAQIEQGAKADVFASADAQWMATLKEHGHVEGEPRRFARNRLVVIVPRTNPARIGKLADLARPGVKFVIGVESVPVGRYAREMLARLGAEPGFDGDFARRALANVVSQEENVKGVVGKVQLGEADAGICYRSDVTASVARLVRVIEIPAEANAIADYPIAVVAGAPHADLAREFVAQVLAAEGQRALERNGLVPATPANP
jgi:molybdate transport system substrate-binding protein